MRFYLMKTSCTLKTETPQSISRTASGYPSDSLCNESLDPLRPGACQSHEHTNAGGTCMRHNPSGMQNRQF
jgi:hypothetical protein